MQNMTIPSKREGRKSERLTKDEHKALLKYIRTFPTKTDAAYAIGILRQVLDTVSFKGSGSPETIGLIREKINGRNINGLM